MVQFRIRLAIALSSRHFRLALIVIMVFGYDARPIKSNYQQKSSENKAQKEQIASEFDKLKVSPENFEKVRHLHDTIYYGAVKALIGQMGRKHFKGLTEAEKQRLAKCLNRIETRKKEVVEAAKCLVESRKRQFDEENRKTMGKERQMRRKKTSRKMPFVQEEERKKVPFVQEEERKKVPFVQEEERKKVPFVQEEERKKVPFVQEEERKKVPFVQEEERKKVPFVQEEERNEIKPKTKTKDKPHYTYKSKRLLRYMEKKRRPRRILISDQSDRNRTIANKTAEEAKIITDRVKGRDVKDRQFVGEKRTVKAEEQTETFKPVSLLSSVPLASRADKSVGSRVTNLLVKLLDGRRNDRRNGRWENIYGKLRRLAREMERSKKVPGSKVFEKRMYDIVLDRPEASLSPEEKHSHVGLVQDGLKLIDLAIANRTGSSLHNLRMFSPRFMPITPDKGGSLHNSSLLSPTLLAMYEEHDNRSIGNVPEMLRNAGVGEKERMGLIGMLMDITGTTEKAEQTLEMFKEMNMFNDVGGPLMESADRIVKAFFTLEDSMDTQQKVQCEQNGYTFARKEQIEKLLRDQAVDLSKLPELEELEMYDRMSENEKESSLWATIEQIAAGNASGQSAQKRRVKRTFATRMREPTILSPFIFAPSHGLAVLGPTILSPNAFSPSILAPTILSPHVLSPNLFRAQILSPTLMSPAILSPLMAHPYILSPAVLGSLLLNPTILTPFILTPVAISPSILNPFALSPVIFSPLLLAPDIISPQTLGGAIFSPVMLSPAILTQAYLMVSIFSPSFLS